MTRKRTIQFLCLVTIMPSVMLGCSSLVPIRPPVPKGDKAAVAKLLTQVNVVPERPDAPGYSREQFGGAWAPAAVGNCTVRHEVLAAQYATDLPERCHFSGHAPRADPYTGAPLRPQAADVDHIFPLAAAWDHGAHLWSAAKRHQFANDADRNLVATQAAVNREKSDKTPGAWMPPAKQAHCWYAQVYLTVAVSYTLSVSGEDHAALRRACG